MACTSPVNGFPCGKCLSCRIQYSASWSSRLLHELSTWNNCGCFVTLTYAPEFLGDNNLSVRDLQLFIKKLRKKVSPQKIKHFSCGEYGDLSARKHYHSIIFGLDCSVATQKLIEDLWSFGFVKVGTVTYDSCRYVSDYVLKKYNGKKAYEVYQDKQPPFRIMSNGLGKAFVLSDLDNFINNDGFYIRGKKRSLPRYYRDVIYFHLLETKGMSAALAFNRSHAVNLLHCSENTVEQMYRTFEHLGNRTLNIVQYVKNCAAAREAHSNYNLKNRAKGGL